MQPALPRPLFRATERGAANSTPTWQAQRRQEVAELRAGFAERIVSNGPALGAYAEAKTHLRRLGRPVNNFDLLIGSTTLFHGLTLVTHNTRHFADIVGIGLEDWVQEYEAGQQVKQGFWCSLLLRVSRGEIYTVRKDTRNKLTPVWGKN